MSDVTISNWKKKGLRFQYTLTAVVATGLGFCIMFLPDFTLKLFSMKPQDQVVYGISGAVYMAFGLLSFLGLRQPLKWLPILVLQFAYKIIWFAAVVAPLLVMGRLDISSSIWLIGGYIVFVAGDLWAIPFGYIFSKEQYRM